ncbi:MAG: hypothetical protein ACTSRZ_21435 [Promethearchaeota archaeon]
MYDIKIYKNGNIKLVKIDNCRFCNETLKEVKDKLPFFDKKIVINPDSFKMKNGLVKGFHIYIDE